MTPFQIATLAATLATGTAVGAAPAYSLISSIPLGAPDRWDYVVADAETGRVYVAHGDRVAVVDGRAAKLIGQVEGIAGGTHGVAISKATGQGFTDDGRAGKVVVFDLKSFKITRQIAADDDADAISIDRATGHIFVAEGDPGAVTVIDAKIGAPVATIKVGEKVEYTVTDDKGLVYVAGEAKGDLVKIDARTNAVIAHWAAPDCQSPHGLAIDKPGRRLFMGCVNSILVVFDADSGRVVARLPIGRGSDAVAYDTKRRRVFSSNGTDGTISVYQQAGGGSYKPLDTIQTAVSGRTMSVDPVSGNLYVAAADTDPNPKGGRPIVRSGTLRLMVFAPAD